MTPSQVKSLLKSKNLKATKSRIHLLYLIADADRPVSVPELKTRCEQTQLKPDEATLYRNIEQLTQAKVLRRLDFQTGSYSYELANQKHHHHLVCKVCGQIQPIYDQCLQISDQAIKKTHQFKVTEHTLEFFGYCKSCQ